MNKRLAIPLMAGLFFAACTSHQKKILIYASSDVQVDEAQKNITVTDGTTQVEKELSFNSADPVVLQVSTPRGHFTLEAKDDGLYLANLIKDTLVGSLQHTGSARQTRVSQEQLKSQLDSLNQLIRGANVSPAAKNFFIVPGKMEKISTFTNARIFGPFVPVPSAFDAGSVPEVYKFYTVSEERETINKLTEMTIYKYEPQKK